MGSIQNKRGSVRQVPPQVYSGFHSGPDDNDNAEDWKFVGAMLFVIVSGFLIVGTILSLLSFGGMEIDEWLREK